MQIIERVTEKVNPITEGERDFAAITHKPEPERIPKYYFRHKETQAEYSWIEGAFAPPGFQYPGFAVVIGMDRLEHPDYKTHFIRVLEEFETKHQTDIKGLIKGCMALKDKYGAYPCLHQGFHTELDQASSDRIYNVISKRYGEESEFWPIPGPYSNIQTGTFDFQQYLITLAHYKTTLDLRQSPKLKSYILMVKKGKDLLCLKPEDNPAIAATAYAVTALIDKRPWRFDLPEEAVFELQDEYW